MTPLQKGDPVSRNWRAVNVLAGEVATLRAGQAPAGTPRDARGLHPFQIYTMPACARTAATAAPENDWRRFRVRSGFVLGVEPSGTDGAAWPDSGAFSGTYTDEITVDAESPQHWFWLQKSGDAWSVQHDDTPDLAGWTAFPTPDAENIPIGWVDTDTHAATYQAVVRQLLRSDVVVKSGGGGMNWKGEWQADTAYSIYDVVTISSQPNMGTYIATDDIPDDADPPYAGGDWAQFPFSEVGVWT